jgi:hypothetical protein
MLKIKAHATAQPVALNRRTGAELTDGWGLPRQTVYIKDSKYRALDAESYKDISDYQTEFFQRLDKIIKADTAWATANGWDKLPKIYNDPVRYSAESLINDTVNHYKRRHDPTLSMLLRQRYLIRKLASELGDPSVIKDWDIDITFKNPTEPVLKKFYDKDIFSQVAITTAFTDLFV